ncbi:proteinase-activated receptor 1-like [Hyperolius riggenbachi]|uniref:proteinase-activated receptor 1-like n=1 Tax=Hyperolius riggenbachi TaxID=752182 RepID=UPI0035A31994
MVFCEEAQPYTFYHSLAFNPGKENGTLDMVHNSFVFNPGKENDTPDSIRNSLTKNESITNDTKIYLSSQWLTKFVPSVYTIVLAVSLPLNIMAIIMFSSKGKIKSPAAVYMLNLAAADVLFVCVLPFHIVYRFSGNNWRIGDGMCRFATAAFYCNMYCSVLLMTSISVDRFLVVVFTMRSLAWRTKKRAWMVCLFIWIISVGSTVPLLVTNQTLQNNTLPITTCHDVLELESQQNFYIYYFTIFSSIFFFLPLIITTLCYICIIRRLSTKEIKDSCKKRRSVLLAITVLFAFLICFGPTNIIFLVHYLRFSTGLDESSYFAYILCVCVSSISSCLDPIIYYYASSRCRKYVNNLLCCRKSVARQSPTQRLTGNKELSTKSTNMFSSKLV